MNNWMSSGKRQEKPKQSHKRRKQKQKQLKNLAKVLRQGINCDSDDGVAFFLLLGRLIVSYI
jgi:hypothetical protein